MSDEIIHVVTAVFIQRANVFFLDEQLVVTFSSPKVMFPYKLIANNKEYYKYPPSASFLQDGKTYQLTLSFNRSMVPHIIHIEEIVNER